MSLSTNFEHQSLPHYRSTTISSHNGNNTNQLFNEWKYRSQSKLKTTIQGNYVERANKSVQSINKILKQYINTNIPIFTLSRTSITNTLRSLFYNVDQWSGVDISATRSKLKTFNEYMKRADNWWNRKKAEWIGDYFFTILFTNDVKQYINSITYNNNCILCNQQSNNNNNKYNTNFQHLLLFLMIKALMHTEVKFKRSKNQPLILDQCYSKSPKLQKYFKLIGSQHSVEWVLPQNVTDTRNYRTIVRKYAINWIDALISATLSSMNVSKIENINFSVCICDHKHRKTYASPQPNRLQTHQSHQLIPIQNTPCNCNVIANNCSECNTIINNININQPQIFSNNNINTPLIGNNFHTNYNQTLQNTSDNNLIISRPYRESPHYYNYQSVAMCRPHPYANIQMQYNNTNTLQIPMQTNYDRVRGPSVAIPTYGNDNRSCVEPLIGEYINEFNNPFTCTDGVIFDYNYGETMSKTETALPFPNDDEMNNAFTNSLCNYSFEGVFN